MRRIRRKNRAFTLTELAIVLSVIGLIMSGIWWAAGSVREAQKEDSALTELTTVVQNIVSIYTGRGFSGSFPVSMTSTLISNQAIPGNYVDIANTQMADNPWSPKNFIVTALSAGTYRVSFNNVSNKGCIMLALQATACQAGQSGCPYKIWADNAGVSLPASGSLPTTGWVTIATPPSVIGLCAANSYTGGANSIDLDYAL